MGWLLGCFRRCASSDRSASPPPPPYKYRSPASAPRRSSAAVAPKVAAVPAAARRSRDFAPPPPPQAAHDAAIPDSRQAPLRQTSCSRGRPLPQNQNEYLSHPLSQLDELEAELEDLRRQIDLESEDARRMREEVNRLKSTVKSPERLSEPNHRRGRRAGEENNFDPHWSHLQLPSIVVTQQQGAALRGTNDPSPVHTSRSRSPKSIDGAYLQLSVKEDLRRPYTNPLARPMLLSDNRILSPKFDESVDVRNDDKEREEAEQYSGNASSPIRVNSQQELNRHHSLHANPLSTYDRCTARTFDGEIVKRPAAVSPLVVTSSLFQTSMYRQEEVSSSLATEEDEEVCGRSSPYKNASGMAVKKRGHGNVESASVLQLQEAHFSATESQNKRQRHVNLGNRRNVEVHFSGCDTLSTVTESTEEGSEMSRGTTSAEEPNDHEDSCGGASRTTVSAPREASRFAAASHGYAGSEPGNSSRLMESFDSPASSTMKTTRRKTSTRHAHETQQQIDSSCVHGLVSGEQYSGESCYTQYSATTSSCSHNNAAVDSYYGSPSSAATSRHRYDKYEDAAADNMSSASYSASSLESEETVSDLSPERCFSPPINQSLRQRSGSASSAFDQELDARKRPSYTTCPTTAAHRYGDKDGEDYGSLDDDASAEGDESWTKKRYDDNDGDSLEQTPIKLPQGVATPSSGEAWQKATATATDKDANSKHGRSGGIYIISRRGRPTASVLTPVENVSQWMQLKQRSDVQAIATTPPAAVPSQSEERRQLQEWRDENNWTPGRKERSSSSAGADGGAVSRSAANAHLSLSTSSSPSSSSLDAPPSRLSVRVDVSLSRWAKPPPSAAADASVPAVDVSLSHWLQLKKHSTNVPQHDENAGNPFSHPPHHHLHLQKTKRNGHRDDDHEEQQQPAAGSSMGIEVSISKASKWAYYSSSGSGSRNRGGRDPQRASGGAQY